MCGKIGHIHLLKQVSEFILHFFLSLLTFGFSSLFSAKEDEFWRVSIFNGQSFNFTGALCQLRRLGIRVEALDLVGVVDQERGC